MHYFDYNEQTQHGTPQFPFAFYRVDQDHPRYHMPWHWHQEYEIIRIVQGQITLSLDSEELMACAGDLIFIHDGMLHGGVPEHCIYECVVFDLRLLPTHSDTCRSYFHLISGHQKQVKNHIPAAQRDDLPMLFSCADHLFSCAQESFPGQELFAVGLLSQLFGAIFRYDLWEPDPVSPSAIPDKKHRLKQIRSILKYIEANYANDITLNQLSAIAGMSPKYFCRFFESVLHKTPIEYLNYYRIERACYELSLEEASVTEVGYDCGFHDTSYFIRMFKREKGVTPLKYKQELLQRS